MAHYSESSFLNFEYFIEYLKLQLNYRSLERYPKLSKYLNEQLFVSTI